MCAISTEGANDYSLKISGLKREGKDETEPMWEDPPVGENSSESATNPEQPRENLEQQRDREAPELVENEPIEEEEPSKEEPIEIDPTESEMRDEYKNLPCGDEYDQIMKDFDLEEQEARFLREEAPPAFGTLPLSEPYEPYHTQSSSCELIAHAEACRDELLRQE